MDRRDSGYGADHEMMDPVEDPAGQRLQGQKGVLRTLPLDDQELLKISADDDGSAVLERKLNLKEFQRDSLISSEGSFEANDDTNKAAHITGIITCSDSIQDTADDDHPLKTSPNQFVLWEEPHSSPVPKKALLRATLSLPVSPVYRSESAEEKTRDVHQSVFQFSQVDINQTTDRGTSPLQAANIPIDERPKWWSSENDITHDDSQRPWSSQSTDRGTAPLQVGQSFPIDERRWSSQNDITEEVQRPWSPQDQNETTRQRFNSGGIADRPRPRSSYADLMPSSLNTLQSFYDADFEGSLCRVDLLEGTKTNRWFVLHNEKLLMFVANTPEAELLESWDLAECKIANVPQKIEFVLVTKFSAQHSFQIKRNEAKSITILSAETNSLCKKWLHQLTTASNNAWKTKGSKLFQTLSLKAHFTKSPNRWRQKSKPVRGRRPQMSKASFADTYGWAEHQSHRRVHRTVPIETKADVSLLEKQRKSELKLNPLNPLTRANSDSNLVENKRTESESSLDRSNSTEPQMIAQDRTSWKFGSLRKTIAALPQLGGKSTPTTKTKRPALAISYSTPLEPSAKAGMLLVKRHSSWNRCWVKLHGSNLHFYKDSHEPLPFEVLSLLGYSVQHTNGATSPIGQVRFKFILQSQEKGSIQFLAETELDGKLWVKRFQEACINSSAGTMDTSTLLTKPAPRGNIEAGGYDQNSNETILSDASDSPSESPLLQQKRMMIRKKYQQANETEEINSLKRSLILNQRRMSAQTKLNALDKQLLEQKKAKNKKAVRGSSIINEPSNDASTKELIQELHRKVEAIDKELSDNILKTDQRRQALLRKQEMELEILHQEKELMKYRSRAQAALKTMMLRSVLPSSLSEEKEDDIDCKTDSGTVSNLTGVSCIRDGDQLKSNSISSSMSSLSSNSTNESYGSSSSQYYSNSKTQSRFEQFSSRSMDSVFSNQGSTPDSSSSVHHQPINKKHSPVSSPDMRLVNSRIPEQDSLNTSDDSDSVDGLLSPPSIKPKLRTEVPPDVLRDINEFEEMAKQALRKAGWLPADSF